jgi:hypothetical protein
LLAAPRELGGPLAGAAGWLEEGKKRERLARGGLPFFAPLRSFSCEGEWLRDGGELSEVLERKGVRFADSKNGRLVISLKTDILLISKKADSCENSIYQQ